MLKLKPLLLSLTIFSSALAQDYPSPSGAVNDFAGLLSYSQRQELEANLRGFFDRTGAAIVVATFESLDGVPIEDYAVGLFEKWKIGQKGLDNGLLILIAKQERKIRFEVGYGLEPVIPDGRAGEIIRTQMTPRFKEGDFYGGISAGVAEAERILEKYFATGEIEKPRSGPPAWFVILLLVFVVAVIFGVVFSAVRRAGLPRYMRGSHWQRGQHGLPWWMTGGSGGWSSGGGGGSGGFGGGFGGFGGGSSGGGGATGGW
ncbi:MAG: TPM domain-containing protein [candidate division Zixibacteria bacterium]|nr:TPM domain-containing protein [candidate division Zixibacteria bacterium]